MKKQQIRKILFVDDDPGVLGAMRAVFSRRFVVHTAESPQSALGVLAAEGPFALVVSDLRMPGMNGIDFFRRVQEVSPGSVRVMLTGYADLDSAMEAVNAGQVFRFHTKPCAAEILEKTVADALRTYERTGTMGLNSVVEGEGVHATGATKRRNPLASKSRARSDDANVTADEILFLLGEVPRCEEKALHEEES
jgi:DNA-binding NtrC family response regulator